MKAQIMAIGNVTPDSFYGASRLESARAVLDWAQKALMDGAAILDIGGCSTRPGSEPASEEEEWRRVAPALETIRTHFPEAQLSLDTFRPSIAQKALEQFGPMIINDVSGGCGAMWEIVRAHHAPYVWTLRGELDAPTRCPERLQEDVILDPGFGFTGGVEADYRCLRQMDQLAAYGRPVLVGVSRKSMVYKPLRLTPETCLSATQAIQLYALEHGATILRTHDILPTAEIISLWEKIVNCKL